MEAVCTHCGARHILKDEAIAKHDKVQFKCSKCSQTTVVELRKRPDATVVISPLPSFARASASSTNPNLPPADDGLRLPATKSIVLTVLTGPDRGKTFKLTKPRLILGRKGTDVPLNDPEISRNHCLLEVRDTAVNLKDLDSTNGTFFDEERIRAAFLVDGAEFRIGTSLIRLNIQPA